MKRHLASAGASLALAGSLLGAAQPSHATTATATSPTVLTMPSIVQNTWQYNYKDNYFYSRDTCVRWGKWASNGGIPGVLAYYCHQDHGEDKWSIDLYWD